MSVFGSKEKPKDDLSDIAASLEDMARAAEIEALAKAPELFAEYVEEHRAQSDEYHFECQRFGDFLTIKVARAANKIPEFYWGRRPLSKLSASINLAKVAKLSFSEGYGPDHKGTLGYRFAPVRDAVEPAYPYLPEWRRLLESPGAPSKFDGAMQMYQEPPHKIKHTTSDFPRPAEDDVITFDGLGERLWAPAGMGEVIMAAVLAEIESGYERPELPRKG